MEDLKNKTLYEVSSIEPIDDKYRIVVKGDIIAKPRVNYGDIIYECYLTGESGKPFSYVRPDFNYTSDKDDLIELNAFSNSGSTITYNVSDYYSKEQEIKDIKSEKNSLVYKLIYKKDFYIAEFNYNGKKINTLQIDNLPNITKDDTNNMLDLTKGYSAIIDHSIYGYCTSLPTAETYYSEDERITLKNISQYYYMDFIKDSNMHIVVICLGVFLGFFIFCYRNRDYEILSKKSLSMFTFALFCMMPILVFITYSFLSVSYK